MDIHAHSKCDTTVIAIQTLAAIVMDLRSSYIFFFVALNISIVFAESDIRYILPSTNGATCPSTNCIVLSHTAENNYTFISGSNSILLFLPGNHTLTASLTIQNLSSFMMIVNKGFLRPVINCEQSANFLFLSISHVRIDGLSLNGCFNNRVSMVDDLIIKDSTMMGNRKVSGRAFVVTDSTIIATGSVFESFNEALYLLQSSAYISNCSFINNRALMKGGALHIEDCYNITIEFSTFSFHACKIVHSCTGAVLYSTLSEVLITNCTFDKNKDGAIVTQYSEVRIINSCFSENVARLGAAIQVNHGSLTTITDTHFCYNEVDYDYYKLNVYTLAAPGGAIRCHMCKVEITRSVFEYNKGVALLGIQGQLRIKSCRLSHNTAAELGGGVYATLRTNIEISGTTLFENNVANYGAAFHAFLSTITIVGMLSIVNNTANLGAIGIVHSITTIRANIIFSENIGSFFVYSGEVSIVPFSDGGKAIFTKNYQINKARNVDEVVRSEFIREGGAITLFVSRLELRATTILSHNVANNGGGIVAITSTVVCHDTLEISFNVVTDTGGGLYLYQSELSIFGIVTLSNNRANVCGGGVHAVSAFLKVMRTSPHLIYAGAISFELNVAEECGGGAFFETGSKIYILRYGPDTVQYIENTADYGGAVYVADDTNIGMCSSGQKHTLTAATQSECFFQLLSVTKPTNNSGIITDAFCFKENRANYLGADLFGGLLDRCTVNSYSNLIKYSSIQGFADDIEHSSTSKPVRICLCNSTKHVVCGSQPVTNRVKKDEEFTIHVAAVDQMNHTVNATIHSYLTSNLGRLGEGQQVQSIGSSCENITFSITSPKQSKELVIYAEGPCKDLGISPFRVPVDFIPCHCPLGFEQYKVIKNKCVCSYLSSETERSIQIHN